MGSSRIEQNCGINRIDRERTKHNVRCILGFLEGHVVHLSLPLVVVGVVVSWGCINTVAIAIGLWNIVVPLLWAFSGTVPSFSTGETGKTRTDHLIMGSVVEEVAVLLWLWCWIWRTGC